MRKQKHERFVAMVYQCFGERLAGNHPWVGFGVEVTGTRMCSKGKLRITHLDGSPRTRLLARGQEAISVCKVVTPTGATTKKLGGSASCDAKTVIASLERHRFEARTHHPAGELGISIWL